MSLDPQGRDWGDLVNWDSLGKTYAGLIVAWSVLLFSGMAWLVWNRRLPYIRMRNLPLTIISTLLLHVYLVKIFLAYTTNGHFLCGVEFWIMSVYLPFGIALFQANALQLRNISDQQRKLLDRPTSPCASFAGLLSSELTKASRNRWSWALLTQTQKAYVYIAVGMSIQLMVTAVLFATSPVLQGDWSSFPMGLSHSQGQALCRRSYAWIPSALWQLAWAWVLGPYTLYKVRDIQDVHHWRLQTILSVVSGLPGTPLWLTALYSDAFTPVNRWWVPPMWLAPGIMIMQLVTIMFPIYGYFKQSAYTRRYSPEHYRRSSDTLRIPAKPFHSAVTDEEMIFSDTNHLFNDLVASGIPEGLGMYRMAALDRALAINPAPLLYFAARKDFSAENIIFLLQVRGWRNIWRTAPRHPTTGEVIASAQEYLLNTAVHIYCDSITLEAEFPINIEDNVSRNLREILGPYVERYNEVRAHSPTQASQPMSSFFDVERFANHHGTTTGQWSEKKMDDFKVTVISTTITPASSTVPSPLESRQNIIPEMTMSQSQNTFHRPPGFNEDLFDAAEASILYLVLTNTWRRFVKQQQEHPKIPP